MQTICRLVQQTGAAFSEGSGRMFSFFILMLQRFKFCLCRNVQCAQWSRQPQARRLLVSTRLCKTHKAYTVCTIIAYHVSFRGIRIQCSSQVSATRVSLPVTEGALLLSTPIYYTAFPPVHPFPLSRVLMYKKYSTL